MTCTTRETWETPALLVFTRNKSEEAVLQACKIGATIGPGGAYGGGGLNGCVDQYSNACSAPTFS